MGARWGRAACVYPPAEDVPGDSERLGCPGPRAGQSLWEPPRPRVRVELSVAELSAQMGEAGARPGRPGAGAQGGSRWGIEGGRRKRRCTLNTLLTFMRGLLKLIKVISKKWDCV